MMNVRVDQRKRRACYTVERVPRGVGVRRQGAHVRAPAAAARGGGVPASRRVGVGA